MAVTLIPAGDCRGCNDSQTFGDTPSERFDGTTDMEDTMTTSLVSDTDTRIDAATAFQQINHGDTWRMARLGAHNRAHSEQSGYIQFDVTLGHKYRVIVKLDADDTYAVEIGRLRKSSGSSIREYQVLSQVRGIYWDVLGEVIERACLKVAGV